MVNLTTNIDAIMEVQNVEKQAVKDMINVNSDSTKSNATKTYKTSSDNTLKKLAKNDSDDFNTVLNKLKSNKAVTSKVKDTRKSNDLSKDTTKLNKDEVLNKLEELDEKLENLTDEQLLECLNLLANLMNSFVEDNSSNLGDFSDGLITELKANLVDFLNTNEHQNISVNESLEKVDFIEVVSTALNNMVEILNKVDANETIDNDTLKFAEKLLSELNTRVDNNADSKKIEISALVNELSNKVNELVANNSKTEETLSLTNSSLNNIYKDMAESNNYSNSKENSSDNSSAEKSQDEKVLDSILNDKSTKDSVPVFTTQTIVNNTTGVVVETQQVNKGTMATDVVQSIKYMATNDMREMIVKVNPGNLGEITIRLIEEEGMMKLHMKATSKETYSLLVQQSEQIKNQLNDQNIRIQDVNISLYEEDTTFFKEGQFTDSFNQEKGNKRNENASSKHEILEDNDDTENDHYDSNAVDMLA